MGANPARYDVFLSFRGADTRRGFAGSLYNILEKDGRSVFMDDSEIHGGDIIGAKIKDAVYDSRLFLPIFSPTYASSKWCLKEVGWMVDCLEKFPEKKILPVFFDVDADDVKLKSDLYKKNLELHEKEFGHETVVGWEKALKKAAEYKGFNRSDTARDWELQEKISRHITLMLEISRSPIPDNLIGIEEQVKEIEEELDIDDVLMVVIHGIGGIGKTTIAGAVFDRIRSSFQFSSFISNVRESSKNNGIVNLQKVLLKDADRFSSHDIRDERDGMRKIEGSFRRNKGLIVLDDVNDMEQIKKLVGMGDWLKLGSKVIITTRDTSCVAHVDEITGNYVSLHGKRIRIYEMKNMDRDASLRLFCRCAFKKDEPPSDYKQISHDIVSLTRGVPLAIEVIGSNLRGRRMEIWNEMLNKLKKAPHEKLFPLILQSSYEALSDHAKEIFHDIACIFHDMEIRFDRSGFSYEEHKTRAFVYWEACGLSPNLSIEELISNAFIKITFYVTFSMHDLIKDLGRELGQRQSNGIHEDDVQCLQQGEASNHVKALLLDGRRLDIREIELPRLPKLKLLWAHRMKLTGGCVPELRWLELDECEYVKITIVNFEKLNVLRLARVDWINDTWEGWKQLKKATNLKALELLDLDLTKTPDVSSFLSLEILKVSSKGEGGGLVEIHPSIGYLHSLKVLELKNHCSLPWNQQGNVVHLPSSFCKCKALTKLVITRLNIKQLPENIGDLKSLRVLHVQHTPLENLPESIGGLESLGYIYVWCNRITRLPESIGKLTELSCLYVGSNELRGLPATIWDLVHLAELDISGNKALRGDIPCEIVKLQSLKILNVSNTGISSIHVGIVNLPHLGWLSLICCGEIQELPNLPELSKLETSYELLKAVSNLSRFTNLVTLSLSSDRGYEVDPLVWDASTMSCFQHLQKLQRLTILLPWTCVVCGGLDKLSRLKRLNLFWSGSPSRGIRSRGLEFVALSGSGLTDMRFDQVGWHLYLDSLEIKDCEFLEGVGYISHLSRLKHLEFSGCPRLVRIRGLERLLKSLQALRLIKCDSIPCLPNPPHWRNSPQLLVENCRMLRNYEGPYQGYFRGEEGGDFLGEEGGDFLEEEEEWVYSVDVLEESDKAQIDPHGDSPALKLTCQGGSSRRWTPVDSPEECIVYATSSETS